MRDDNLRRLLYYSALERKDAFSGSVERAYRDGATREHFAILKRDEGRVDEAIAAGLKRLEVKPVWIDTYDEIAYDLAYVYEGTGDSWSNVFDPPFEMDAG